MGKKSVTLHDLAGKVGPGCLALSPALQTALSTRRAALVDMAGKKPTAQFTQIKGVTPKKMTRPEVEMEAMLKKRLTDGDISSFGFEAITLVVGDPPVRYTPDFFVETLKDEKPIKLIEVKGPHIREDAMIKFRAARKQYPFFRWELWQRAKGGEWKQLI